MTEDTNNQNSNVIIRRFCGFLLIYSLVLYIVLGYYNGFVMQTYLDNYSEGIRTFLIFTGFSMVYLFLPLYVVLSGITRSKTYEPKPSPIAYLHLFFLVFSFIVSFGTILFYSFTKKGWFEGDDSQFLITFSLFVFLIALTLKSTFCKQIFMKKK